MDTSSWYHAVITWNATTKVLKLYVNSVLQSTVSADYIGRDTSPLVIGGTGAANRWANTLTDQTITDNEVWTQEHVNNVYYAGTGINYATW